MGASCTRDGTASLTRTLPLDGAGSSSAMQENEYNSPTQTSYTHGGQLKPISEEAEAVEGEGPSSSTPHNPAEREDASVNKLKVDQDSKEDVETSLLPSEQQAALGPLPPLTAHLGKGAMGARNVSGTGEALPKSSRYRPTSSCYQPTSSCSTASTSQVDATGLNRMSSNGLTPAEFNGRDSSSQGIVPRTNSRRGLGQSPGPPRSGSAGRGLVGGSGKMVASSKVGGAGKKPGPSPMAPGSSGSKKILPPMSGGTRNSAELLPRTKKTPKGHRRNKSTIEDAETAATFAAAAILRGPGGLLVGNYPKPPQSPGGASVASSIGGEPWGGGGGGSRWQVAYESDGSIEGLEEKADRLDLSGLSHHLPGSVHEHKIQQSLGID